MVTTSVSSAQLPEVLAELANAQERLGLLLEGLRALFDGVELPMLMTDRQGQVVEINATARRSFPALIRHQARAHRALLQMLDPKTRVRFLQAVDQTMRGEPSVIKGLTLAGKGGEQRAFDLLFFGLAGFSSTPLALVAFVDRHSENDFAREKSLLNSLIDGSSDIIYAFDPEGRLLRGNKALAGLLGMPLSDIVGKARHQFMNLSDAIEHRSTDLAVLESGHTVQKREILNEGPAGSPVVFETRKFPLITDNGDVIGVGGVSRDITPLIRQLHDLQLSEIVFQQSSDAIILIDNDGRIQKVNSAFTAHTGFTEQSVVGRRATMLLHGGVGPAKILTNIERSLAARGIWSGEVTARRANGEAFQTLLRLNAIRDDTGSTTGFIIFETDLSAIRSAELAIDRLERFDPLTGLPNRSLLSQRIEEVLRHAQWRTRSAAVLYIDLDNFKDVNDSLGHAAGDELLTKIADRLRKELRSEDMVARIGGDEFVVLLPDADEVSALRVSQKLFAGLSRPLQLGRASAYTPAMSVGIALYPDHGETPASLLQSADTAMYAAKDAGRGRISLYNVKMRERVDWQFTVRSELPRALADGQMQLYLQPQFRFSDRAVVGAEALLRWHREPGVPPLMPGTFMWAIEQPSLLAQLDQWTFEEGVRLIGAWRRDGLLPSNFALSINKTASSIEVGDWSRSISSTLKKHGVPSSAIQIEFTENILADFKQNILDSLHKVNMKGIKFSIDDFGTGYSSLAYLQKLPRSAIKIDQSFIRNMVSSRSSRELVKTIISLAGNLGLATVAEGVETEHQAAMLTEMGCTFGQGFLMAPALPEQEFINRFLMPVATGR